MTINEQPQHSPIHQEGSSDFPAEVRRSAGRADLVFGEGRLSGPMREDAELARLVRDGLGQR